MADGKAGRPNREFDKRTFESLCHIQCTKDEIEDVLHSDQRTIDKWCLRTYDEDFSTTYKRFSSGGKSSIRRAQYRHAIEGGNATLLIWLGKQYLAQRDLDSEDTKRFAKGVYETITHITRKENDRANSQRKAA